MKDTKLFIDENFEVRKCLINRIHSLYISFIRFIFEHFIYSEKIKKTVTKIENALLLEPSTVLALKIRTREVSCVEVITAFIARIQEINPMVNCVVHERYLEALREASEVDQMLKSGLISDDELKMHKPLLGVPITIKNSIQVEGIPTTVGSFYRQNVTSESDAQVIELLKNAGAIILCATNTPELCIAWETNTKLYGKTRNPYDYNRTCGGSSGGEAAVLSAGGSVIGIGSDIGSSIRVPAAFTGIFGHKPSKHVVSSQGHYPVIDKTYQEPIFSIGPMTRYACDLAPLLKVIANKDKLPLLKLDEPVDISKIKIYYQMNDCDGLFINSVEIDIQNAIKNAVDYFETFFKCEVHRVEVQNTRNTIDIWFANNTYEIKSKLPERLTNSNEPINVWKEFIKFIFGRSRHSILCLYSVLQKRFGVQFKSIKHTHLMEKKRILMDKFQELLGQEDSIFIYPTHPTTAVYHNESFFRLYDFAYSALFNILELPATSIPMGLDSQGLPVGIQVAANHHNDRLCLAVARQLEQVFGGWLPPG